MRSPNNQSEAHRSPLTGEHGGQKLAIRTVGVLGCVGVLVGAGALYGNSGSFLNLPAALIVFGGTAALLVVTFGLGGSLTAVRLAFRDTEPAAPQPMLCRCDPVAFFRLAAAYALGMGLLGMLIGLIGLLSNMDDPSGLGAGLALSLLAVLYGAGVALPCLAISVIQSMRYPNASAAREATRFAIPIAGAATAMGSSAAIIGVGALLWFLSP